MLNSVWAALGAAFVCALAGAWLYRVHGGGFAWMPVSKIVSRTGIAILIAAPAWPLAPWWLAGLVGVAAWAALATPHGSGLDMGHSPRDDPDELWRHLWLGGDGYATDAAFMAVSGLLVTAALFVPLGHAAVAGGLSPWWLPLPLAGALKGPCYALAWRLDDTLDGDTLDGDTLDGDTLDGRPLWHWPWHLAEYLTGAVYGGAPALLWLAG